MDVINVVDIYGGRFLFFGYFVEMFGWFFFELMVVYEDW